MMRIEKNVYENALKDGFQFVCGDGNIPRGRLYEENKPIADVCRLLHDNSFDNGVYAPIFKMSPLKRKIALLYFINGERMDDISFMLDVPMGTVKASVRQMKEKAKKVHHGKLTNSERARYNENEKREEKIKMIKNIVLKMKSVSCRKSFIDFNDNFGLLKLRKANQKIK